MKPKRRTRERGVLTVNRAVHRSQGRAMTWRHCGLCFALALLVNTLPSLASSSSSALSYPDCTSNYTLYIGDGACNDFNNNVDCAWDGGDCCECECNGEWCGSLGFDCQDQNSTCYDPGSARTFSDNAEECKHYGGNGNCDDFLNKDDGVFCRWDGGDCCPCSCEDGDEFNCGDNGYDCKDSQICDPTPAPTEEASASPTTRFPTAAPTTVTTVTPLTILPSNTPTISPQSLPTPAPIETLPPTMTPSPTITATEAPTTNLTARPFREPTPVPTSLMPSAAPTSEMPVTTPTTSPSSAASISPQSLPTPPPIETLPQTMTPSPTITVTEAPTTNSTARPSREPTPVPTSLMPSAAPTSEMPVTTPTTPPSSAPSISPQSLPTPAPIETLPPTMTPSPTTTATEAPTTNLTARPSREPTPIPTSLMPSAAPTNEMPVTIPTTPPSSAPSISPQSLPTPPPIESPPPNTTPSPTITATEAPTTNLTARPSREPTPVPTSLMPSAAPTSEMPVTTPTTPPSSAPSISPQSLPTPPPIESPPPNTTPSPTITATEAPTTNLTARPSREPTPVPTSLMPSAAPTSEMPVTTPTTPPSSAPSISPQSLPTPPPIESPPPTTTQPPTITVTEAPTTNLTARPSREPTTGPTLLMPSAAPTSEMPVTTPTTPPSSAPSMSPQSLPTPPPIDTPPPTMTPSPTTTATEAPTTNSTARLSREPTPVPTSLMPSAAPTSEMPVTIPTTLPSSAPSMSPQSLPTPPPIETPPPTTTPSPTITATEAPITSPSARLSLQPTPAHFPRMPSAAPTREMPVTKPTTTPSSAPTISPEFLATPPPTETPPLTTTPSPTITSTEAPTTNSTARPSREPTPVSALLTPSAAPTSEMPVTKPTTPPSSAPSISPVFLSTETPTETPPETTTSPPTTTPSLTISAIEDSTTSPIARPSREPTPGPTSLTPSATPTSKTPVTTSTTPPSSAPTTSPEFLQTSIPFEKPSPTTTRSPTTIPTGAPTTNPSTRPSREPSPTPTSLMLSAAPTSEIPVTTPTTLPSSPPSDLLEFPSNSSPPMSTLPAAPPAEYLTLAPIPSTFPVSSPTLIQTISTSVPRSVPTFHPPLRPMAEVSVPTHRSASPAPFLALPAEPGTVAPIMTPTAIPTATPTTTPTAIPTTLSTSASPTGTPTTTSIPYHTSPPSDSSEGKPNRHPSIPTLEPMLVFTPQPDVTPFTTAPPITQPADSTSSPTDTPTGYPTDNPTTPPTTAWTATPTTAPYPEPDSPFDVADIPFPHEAVSSDPPTASNSKLHTLYPTPNGTPPVMPVLETKEPITPSPSTARMPWVISSPSPTRMLPSGSYLVDKTDSPTPLVTSATPTIFETMSPTAAPEDDSFDPTWNFEETWPPAPSNGDQTSAPFVTTTFMSRTGASETVSIAAVGSIAASILSTILSREPAASMAAAAVVGTGQVLQSTRAAIGGMSIRKSSATLAYLLTSQLQFLATLSLLDYYTTEDKPWLYDFGTRLRWLNLWWPASFTRDATTESHATRRSLTLSSTCDWGDTGFFVSVGNLALVAGILLCIFLLHLLVLSGLEAYWLLEKRAKAEWEGAPRRGMTEGELMMRISGTPARQRVLPGADIDHDMGADTAAMDAGITTASTPICDNHTLEGKEEKDEEKGSMVDDRSRHDMVDPIIDSRDKSSSAWLHFPHVELLFLFFAFEGFVAAQVYGVQQSRCLPAQIVAAVVLVLYPVLMFMGVCRTTMVRVCSKATIEFRRLANEDKNDGGCMSRLFSLWRHDHSLFSWRDKGRWHTVQTSDEVLWRENNWFRIGFEPMFVDFTQSGAWFTIIFLLEWTSFACIAVLVERGTMQLFLFCGIHLGAFIALMIFRPFANKVMDFMASIVSFINAVSMALMATSNLAWSDATEVTRIYNSVAFLQLLVLLVLVVPIYIDLVAVIMTVMKTHPFTKQEEAIDQNEKAFVRGFIRHTWASTWYNFLCWNLCAYVKDIREGIRSPRASLRRVR